MLLVLKCTEKFRDFLSFFFFLYQILSLNHCSPVLLLELGKDTPSLQTHEAHLRLFAVSFFRTKQWQHAATPVFEFILFFFLNKGVQ